MERIIRVAKVSEQDGIRREDAMKMTPAERVAALVRMRDNMAPYQPLARVVSVRKRV